MIKEDSWILHILLGLRIQIHQITLCRPVRLINIHKLGLCFRVLANPKHDLVSRSPDGIQFRIFKLRVEIDLESGNFLYRLNKVNKMQFELFDGLELVIGRDFDAFGKMLGGVLEVKIIALDE